MRSLEYKNLIWNTSWYKQNSSQALSGLNKTIVHRTDQVPEQQEAKKKMIPWELKDIFPWWRSH